MLPLFPNQLLVSLSKEGVSLIYRGGLTKSIIGETFINAQMVDVFDWRPLLQQLDQSLTSLKLPAESQLLVTLSSDMVRYLMLPSQNVNMSQAEKIGYANAAYKEIYGFVISNWIIKCHDAPPNKPILTSAIDFELFEQIQELALKHRLSIKSIQPYLMTAFNALSKSISGSNAILAVIEPHRILVVNLHGGYCYQVRTYHHTGDWQEKLAQLVARESLMGDVNVRDILVYAPLKEKNNVQVDKSWLLKSLEIKNKMNILKAPYAMLEAFV